jgi:2-phospho-L-lactate transferase/gluconeogenesis factor (CofD/UPF0052 family)
MDTAQITDVIVGALRNANLARASDDQLTVSADAVIFGPGSPLDSMGLVALLIDIEEALASEGVRVSLSDDRAMSQSHSPFRSVPRLAEFISVLIGSTAHAG